MLNLLSVDKYHLNPYGFKLIPVTSSSKMADSIIQVLVKNDYSQQTLCTLPASSPFPPLAPSSVRVRTTVIALTTNNLSYAIGGTMLHWWDTYPVPTDLPAPYNDRSVYGTVAAWGYGTVLESTTSIAPGTLLRGYFPLSTLPTDLQLRPAPAPGHWIETSPHRAQVLPLYHRYISTNPATTTASLTPQILDGLAWDSLLGVLWECAYLLNRLSFSPAITTPPVHPSGGADQPWTTADADLTHATVVLLAASGKTAISFAQQLRHARDPGSGPLAVVAVTSASSVPFLRGTGFYTSVLSYADLDAPDADAVSTLVAGRPGRIVVCDFGARGNFAEDLHGALRSRAPSTPLTMLGVGFEAKVYQAEEMGRLMAKAARLQLVQMNTSALRDRAMEMMGQEAYFKEMGDAWRAVKGVGGVPGMRLSWGQGMRGQKGVEDGWERLCRGQVGPEEGLVFRL